MPTAVVNGLELYCEQTGGAGEPLVLVHGAWTEHRTWDRIVPALARSFRVLAYDRRGHSLSARPAGQGSIRDDVADLGALIERFNFAPAHVVGNSFGGSVALRLAAERPDLFRTLNVHEPPLHGLLADHGVQSPLRSKERAALDLLEKGQMETGARQFYETVIGRAWEELPVARREAWVFNAVTFLDEQRDPEWLALDLTSLATFSPPVLLTHGDQSDPSFVLIIDQLARALPQAQRRTLLGASHAPQGSHPDDYVQTIEWFIRHSVSGRT